MPSPPSSPAPTSSEDSPREPSHWAQEFQPIEQVAQSEDATVWKARSLADGGTYCVTVHVLPDDPGDAARSGAAALLTAVTAPTLLRYYRCWAEREYVYVQTEVWEMPLDHAHDARRRRQELAVHRAQRAPPPAPPNPPTALRNASGQPVAASATPDRPADRDDDERLPTPHAPSPDAGAHAAAAPFSAQLLWGELELLDVLDDLLRALEALHAHDLCHGRLGPQTIFLCPTAPVSATGGRPHMYKLQAPGQSEPLLCAVDAVAAGAGKRDSRYVSRELWAGRGRRRYTKEEDVFGLGAVVYELAIGGALPRVGSRGWEAIRNGFLDRAQFVTQYTPELVSLVTCMLSPDPRNRPTVATALALVAAIRGSTLPLTHNSTNGVKPRPPLKHSARYTGSPRFGLSPRRPVRALSPARRRLQSGPDKSPPRDGAGTDFASIVPVPIPRMEGEAGSPGNMPLYVRPLVAQEGARHRGAPTVGGKGRGRGGGKAAAQSALGLSLAFGDEGRTDKSANAREALRGQKTGFDVVPKCGKWGKDELQTSMNCQRLKMVRYLKCDGASFSLCGKPRKRTDKRAGLDDDSKSQ